MSQLRQELGAEQLEEIIGVFIEEATAAIADLRASIDDPSARQQILHNLKGCALMLGARRLGKICKSLEGDTEFTKAHLRQIEAEFSNLRDHLCGHGLRSA